MLTESVPVPAVDGSEGAPDPAHAARARGQLAPAHGHEGVLRGGAGRGRRGGDYAAFADEDLEGAGAGWGDDLDLDLGGDEKEEEEDPLAAAGLAPEEKEAGEGRTTARTRAGTWRTSSSRRRRRARTAMMDAPSRRFSSRPRAGVPGGAQVDAEVFSPGRARRRRGLRQRHEAPAPPARRRRLRPLRQYFVDAAFATHARFGRRRRPVALGAAREELVVGRPAGAEAPPALTASPADSGGEAQAGVQNHHGGEVFGGAEAVPVHHSQRVRAGGGIPARGGRDARAARASRASTRRAADGDEAQGAQGGARARRRARGVLHALADAAHPPVSVAAVGDDAVLQAEELRHRRRASAGACSSSTRP